MVNLDDEAFIKLNVVNLLRRSGGLTFGSILKPVDAKIVELTILLKQLGRQRKMHHMLILIKINSKLYWTGRAGDAFNWKGRC